MSASREKNKRKVQVEEPVSFTAQKNGMSKSLKTTLVVVCVVLAVAAVVFCSMLTDGFFASRATAAKVGGHDLTPATVNYYYRQAYNNTSQYAQYFGLDTSKSLANQYLDEEKTQSWADYLLDTGLNSAAEAYAIYDRAIAEGFKLSEEQMQEIDESVAMISAYAPLNGFKDADAYIAAMYGSGCNEKNFREFMEVNGVAQAYLSDYYNSLTYSDSEIDAEYEANKNEYDTVSYRMISVAPDMFEGNENLADKVKELADTILAASDSEEGFIKACAEEVPDAVKEEYADESATLFADASYSAISDTYADWLFDESRQSGDVEVFEEIDARYVVFFVERNDHDMLLPNVRHILFKVDDVSDAAAMAEAKEKAEAILEQFNVGDKSEESFAALAKENSDDTSAENGGLIENIYPNQMVANFSAWCFDESRQVGDTDIVETEYGYHVMYFSGYGYNYKHALVESALKADAYEAKSAEVSANDGYTIVPFGAKFITK